MPVVSIPHSKNGPNGSNVDMHGSKHGLSHFQVNSSCGWVWDQELNEMAVKASDWDWSGVLMMYFMKGVKIGLM